MKGLEFSKKYFDHTFGKLFEGELSLIKPFCAAGLSGEGSECFGFDDDLSKDHDFSPEYCIWIPYSKYRDFKTLLEKAYTNLPTSFDGYIWNRDAMILSRRGIQTIEGYFQKYTGLTHIPQNNMEWLNIPESFLAVATNGEIFVDYFGEFSRWKKMLKDFYPQDVFYKKLAARVMILAQAGQYNYGRCIKRGDFAAAYLAGHEFVEASLSAIYLLNKSYMPFYKWSFHGKINLSVLRNTVDKLEEFTSLSDAKDYQKKLFLIEDICTEFKNELRSRGLSHATDDFLIPHAFSVFEKIEDVNLKKMNILLDAR